MRLVGHLSENYMPSFEPSDMAFVSLGSNLGESRSIICEAIEQLSVFSSAPLLRSSLWRTEPVDCPPGTPDFVNAAIGLKPRSQDTPESYLACFQELESEFGRRPKRVSNESRTLDLDLITFRHEIRETALLRLPHPRVHLRRFVLEPLSEIAPSLVLPGQIDPVGVVLIKLTNRERIARMD